MNGGTLSELSTNHPIVPSLVSYYIHTKQIQMKTYRIRVTTNDGLMTIWYETSKAKKAPTIICERVYQQLCGLNIKDVEVDLSVPISKVSTI